MEEDELAYADAISCSLDASGPARDGEISIAGRLPTWPTKPTSMSVSSLTPSTPTSSTSPPRT